MTESQKPKDALLIGSTAYDVFAEIVRSIPVIQRVMLVSYKEGPNWPDVHNTTKQDNTFLLKAIEQDQGERLFIDVVRSEVSAEKLRTEAHTLPENRILGVISKVSLSVGGYAHIPMMDFMCTPSEENLKILGRFLRNLQNGKGCLLTSGRSYHYYGFELLSEEQWRVFLGKCLLMYGYSDDRYIGHQLVDGHCVLRLSSGKLKATIPRVVAEFH